MTDRVVRSWKDPRFRASLPAAERARLPQHPAGVVEVPASDLDTAAGAADADCTTMGCMTYEMYLTMWCCGPVTIQ